MDISELSRALDTLCHAIEATLVSSRGQLAPRVHVGVIRGLWSSCAREVYEFVQELTDQGGGGRGRGKKMKMKSKKQDKSKTKGGTKYEVQKDQEGGGKRGGLGPAWRGHRAATMVLDLIDAHFVRCLTTFHGGPSSGTEHARDFERPQFSELAHRLLSDTDARESFSVY